MFDDEPQKKPVSHEIGQDLSALSIEELGKRVGLLKEEIIRLEDAEALKRASMSSAESFFKK